jgi:hypothetical protein
MTVSPDDSTKFVKGGADEYVHTPRAINPMTLMPVTINA